MQRCVISHIFFSTQEWEKRIIQEEQRNVYKDCKNKKKVGKQRKFLAHGIVHFYIMYYPFSAGFALRWKTSEFYELVSLHVILQPVYSIYPTHDRIRWGRIELLIFVKKSQRKLSRLTSGRIESTGYCIKMSLKKLSGFVIQHQTGLVFRNQLFRSGHTGNNDRLTDRSLWYWMEWIACHFSNAYLNPFFILHVSASPSWRAVRSQNYINSFF